MTHPALAIRLAAAALLAVAILAGGRSLLRGRLEVAAADRAAKGDASAVTQAVTDWAEAVVPVALADDGPAGVRARLAVFERLDAHQARRDTTRFVVDAVETLAIARRESLSDAATRSGVAWARRLAERVANEAPRFAELDTRLDLLTASDGVLSIAPLVRGRPPQPEPTEAPIEVEARVAVAPAPVPMPTETAPTPPTTIRLESPPAPSPVAAADPSPAWRPAWEDAATPVAPPEPLKPAPTKPEADGDRALLAELIDSVQRDSEAWRDRPEPRRLRASGPVSVAETAEQRAARLERERLQERLAARGFRGLSTDHVQALLDPSPEVRRALADKLLTSRSGDAVRLLRMLAEDEDATVRAAAVAAMGSSTDRRLVEHAWRIALNDPDPRVGRLAESLRGQLR